MHVNRCAGNKNGVIITNIICWPSQWPVLTWMKHFWNLLKELHFFNICSYVMCPFDIHTYHCSRHNILVLTSLELLLFLFLFFLCRADHLFLISRIKPNCFVAKCTYSPCICAIQLKLEPMLNGEVILHYSLACSVITRCWN